MRDEDGHRVSAPHAWQNIDKALSQADPANEAHYASRSEAYLSQIRALLAQAYGLRCITPGPVHRRRALRRRSGRLDPADTR